MGKEGTPEGNTKGKARLARPSKTVLKTRATVRLGDDLTEQVQALADSRQISFSAVVRTAVEMYLQREEFAVGLNDMEERIAAEFENVRRDTGRVEEDVQMLIAILDQLIKFQLMSTPELIDKEGSVALGNRRYTGFVAELHNAFHTRKKKSVLSQKLEQIQGE